MNNIKFFLFNLIELFTFPVALLDIAIGTYAYACNNNIVPIILFYINKYKTLTVFQLIIHKNHYLFYRDKTKQKFIDLNYLNNPYFKFVFFCAFQIENLYYLNEKLLYGIISEEDATFNFHILGPSFLFTLILFTDLQYQNYTFSLFREFISKSILIYYCYLIDNNLIFLLTIYLLYHKFIFNNENINYISSFE